MSRKHLLSFVVILACAALAIVAHAALPAEVNEGRLDGVLVQKVGFPVVAASYFVLLYAHCAFVIHVNTRNIRHGRVRSGLLLGLVFALLYMVGMQEIMLDVSPFASWHAEYVMYQFFMGLGDAIPVIILCIAISALAGADGPDDVGPASGKTVPTILLLTLVIGTNRLLVSYSGIISSHVLEYTVPVIAWGFALGGVVGIGYVLLQRAYSRSRGVLLYGLGLNWVIFNMFIGLVKSGAFADAATRSVLDVVAMGAAMALVERVDAGQQRRGA
jgi:hypothetical protein